MEQQEQANPAGHRVAERLERLLRNEGATPGGSVARSDALLRAWIRAARVTRASLQLRLGRGPEQLRLHLPGEGVSIHPLELGSFGRRARALGLVAVHWDAEAPEHEWFQSSTMLVALRDLPRESGLSAEVPLALFHSQLPHVHFLGRTPEEPPSRQERELSAAERMQQLTREAARVLLHDLRELESGTAEHEALVRVLVALLSQAADESDREQNGLFAATVAKLDLRDDEWHTLAMNLDPQSSERFLWAFLDRVPEHPEPGLYAVFLARAREVLSTMLRHLQATNAPGVARIVQQLLHERPELFEHVLRTGTAPEARSALLMYEQADRRPPEDLLQELALRLGDVELRCHAARFLQEGPSGGRWALELLDDPVRELRRLALQSLSGRTEHLATMIASYLASERVQDDEERRWRLFAIGACGGDIARSFLHEHLDAFPEARELAASAAPEALEELRRRISL